jgi:putative transposase
MHYSSDLAKQEFKLLDTLIPKSKTKKTKIPRIKIFNAIFYQLKNGCQWRDLPKDFPNWNTVYSQFNRWKQRSVWDDALEKLAKLERTSRGKKSRANTIAG